MQKKKMLQEFLGHRFLVFALFMLIFSGGLKAADLLQIAKAVSDGAQAAMSAVKSLRK